VTVAKVWMSFIATFERLIQDNGKPSAIQTPIDIRLQYGSSMNSRIGSYGTITTDAEHGVSC